jgi:hypothetical protein
MVRDDASLNQNISNNDREAEIFSQKTVFMEMVDELHNINCLY